MPPESPDEPTPRDFTDPTWQASVPDESILSVIRSGKGAMPAFGDTLSDDEIAAAVASVRSFGR